MIRAATPSDIQGMVDVLRWGHQNSLYAHLTFNEREAARIVMACISRHGKKNQAGTWVQVADKEGEVVGLIVGVLNRVYEVAEEMVASDVWWLATPACGGRDRGGLMLSLRNWAQRPPKCHELAVVASDVMGTAAAAEHVLAHMGLEKCGGIWRMDMTERRREVEAA